VARVLLIRQGSFPLDARVRREVECLLDAGHEVDVISLRREGQPGRETWRGANAYRPPLRHRREGALLYVFEHLAFMVMAGLLATFLHLRRRYDVVQANTIPDSVVFAAIGPKLLGARVMLDLHECVPEFVGTKYGVSPRHPLVRISAWVEQAAIRFADRVVTCTEEMKEIFVARGAPAEKIDVVLNAADESIFDPEEYPPQPRRPGRFTLVCHGSVEERYGHDTLVEALDLLREEIPELRLDVYGEGSFLAEVEEMVRERGLEDRVWFARDYVPIEQLLEGLARCDAGVVAMKKDAFRDVTHCNKMYDLIAMRRPAVISRTRSVQNYFDEGCFAYFDAADAEDLARGIRELYADPQLGERLVEHAAEVNEPYRWPRQREIYLRAVESQLGRGTSRPDRRPQARPAA
jgi:glycosyltransferase involved in cell wall biosynthesis